MFQEKGEWPVQTRGVLYLCDNDFLKYFNEKKMILSNSRSLSRKEQGLASLVSSIGKAKNFNESTYPSF